MRRETICGIYKITSPTGRIYIGQSKDIYGRWTEYRGYMYKIKGQLLLYRSLIKHKHENHTFEIIEICDVCHLKYYEIYYIWLYETYNTPHGMNLTTGGEGIPGYRHTEETKLSISKNLTGEKHHQFGKPRTNEVKEKLRIANIGKKASAETRKKISQKGIGRTSGMLGKKRPPEQLVYRIILNTQSGIFYIGLKEAESSMDITRNTLGKKLLGKRKNNTPFIYA
jgi:group I intron endonuclease